MFRKSTIGLAGLAVTACAGLIASGAAAATDDAVTPVASHHTDRNWCTQQGGQAINYSPWYDINSRNPSPLGGSYPLCHFKNADSTHLLVATDTLAADRPTLAALAYTRRPAASETAPPGVNPAAWYCKKIGGTNQFGDSPADIGGWAPSSEKAPKDFVVMCVFPDRSMIDQWGLSYHTHGIIRGADLAGKWKATIPLN